MAALLCVARINSGVQGHPGRAAGICLEKCYRKIRSAVTSFHDWERIPVYLLNARCIMSVLAFNEGEPPLSQGTVITD